MIYLQFLICNSLSLVHSVQDGPLYLVATPGYDTCSNFPCFDNILRWQGWHPVACSNSAILFFMIGLVTDLAERDSRAKCHVHPITSGHLVPTWGRTVHGGLARHMRQWSSHFPGRSACSLPAPPTRLSSCLGRRWFCFLLRSADHPSSELELLYGKFVSSPAHTNLFNNYLLIRAVFILALSCASILLHFIFALLVPTWSLGTMCLWCVCVHVWL